MGSPNDDILAVIIGSNVQKHKLFLGSGNLESDNLDARSVTRSHPVSALSLKEQEEAEVADLKDLKLIKDWRESE